MDEERKYFQSYSLHTTKLVLRHKMLHYDIRRRLNELDLSQREISESLQISRSTLHRIKEGQIIEMDTFLKIVLWLGNDINAYIKEVKE